MGLKKDTLLRWVNCCSDAAPIERITHLADGWFFIHILNFLRSNPTGATDPWCQTINILREYKLQENVIDFDAAASGNEDELAKLIVIIMHLTMVQKPCENIKERSMLKLSTEDQKVIEAILLAIVNDDQLTRSRLIDVLQDNLKENGFTKSVMFYTSSSLSSKKNSPLKLFLDSPLALRLTRLIKEISDKNEEIRRLQSELMTESDESSALGLRMNDMKRKVKDLEKNNTELEQRLRDFQFPESSSSDTDVEVIHLKKKLKKMQNEYETSCQKYCDLNIECEAMKTQQEKDRKQIRQLQLDLNNSVARFERESAEYQLLLNSIRTENAELKQSLKEKTLWIDVLEEKSQACSEMHARLNAPRSPSEGESIGYSLLSIETEKLQCDLESYRRDLIRQSNQFNSEKKNFQQRAAVLEEDKRNLHRQVEEANLENKSLYVQLDQREKNLKQILLNCESLSKERDELRNSLDELQSQFYKEMTCAQQKLDILTKKSLELVLHINSLNQQLEETQATKNKPLEQSIHEVNEQKLGQGQSMTALKQRGSAACSGGTLADAVIDVQRRSMRPTRWEVVSTSRERQEPIEVFRPHQLAFGDGSEANCILKVFPDHRDLTSSVCSSHCDIYVTSRCMNVPHGAGRLFTCDDEDGELFSSSYLRELKEGKSGVEDSSTRVSELLRRNTMQPPHMRSAYPVEMNDIHLRQNDMTIYDQPKASSSRADNHDTLQQLSFATSMLSMNTPPAMNTRKRRSSSWNPTDMESPVMRPGKRRSYELDADLFSDSTDTRSISSSAERKKHRGVSLTSYLRPGPPTPARNAVKGNIFTTSTASSAPKSTSKASSLAHGTKNSKLTPVNSLLRKVQAKIRSNIQDSNENTPSSISTTLREPN